MRLAGMVLSASPGHPAAIALVGLGLEDLAEASPFLDRAAALSRGMGTKGFSPAVRALVQVARATCELVALEPHAAGERLSGLVGTGLPEPLDEAVTRLTLAAASCTGESEIMAGALERVVGLPALNREAAWFAYLHAKRLGKPGAADLLDAAEAAMPSLRAILEGARPIPKAGNPGAFAGAGDAPALAAVLPGLFAAGGLPGRKRMARAA